MTALPPSFDLLWNRNGEPTFPRHGKPLRPPFDNHSTAIDCKRLPFDCFRPPSRTPSPFQLFNFSPAAR